MFEKRKHPRQVVDLKATVTVVGSTDAIVGRVRDLSIGGMFFLGDAKPAFGTEVKVAIEFPRPSGTLHFPAIVRWGGEDGFGVQFGLVGAKETHAVARAIGKR